MNHFQSNAHGSTRPSDERTRAYHRQWRLLHGSAVLMLLAQAAACGSPADPSSSQGSGGSSSNSSSSSSSGSTSSGGMECASPFTCPGNDTACSTRTCVAGVCGVSLLAANTQVGVQTKGDCTQIVCDGKGNMTTIADPNDPPPEDGNVCTVESCLDQTPMVALVPNGTQCDKGDLCSVGNTCNAGVCGGGESCTQGSLCEPAGCRAYCSATIMLPNAPGLDVGAAQTGVVMGDFNGDGLTDAAVTRADNKLGIFWGELYARFTAPTDFPATPGLTGIIAGDTNGDAIVDLLAANPLTGVISLYPNVGNGTFGPVIDIPAGAGVKQVAIAEMNGDGKQDLVALSPSTSSVYILSGNGDGTFGAPAAYATGNGAASFVVADFDGDFKLDVAVTDATAGGVNVHSNNGAGGLGTKTFFLAGTGAGSIATADFDNDGKLDLAVAHATGTSILLGNGAGKFLIKLDNGLQTPGAMAVADFNRDGQLDLLLTHGNDGLLSFLKGRGDGSFYPPIQSKVLPGDVLAIGDFTSNDNPDVILGHSGNVATVLTNDESGRFNKRTDVVEGGAPSDVVIGDINGDHRPDLVLVEETTNTIDVMVGIGDGTFGPKIGYPVGSKPQSLAIADFDGDALGDLLVTSDDDRTIHMLRSLDKGQFSPVADYPVLSPHNASWKGRDRVLAVDVNNDGRSDMVFISSGGGMGVKLNKGQGSFAPVVSYATEEAPMEIIATDLSEDTYLDLVVATAGAAGGNGPKVSVWTNKGDGTFVAKGKYNAGTEPISMFSYDVTMDGRTDVVVANRISQNVHVYPSNGAGDLNGPTITPLGFEPSKIAVANFHGYNITQLVVLDKQSSSAVTFISKGNGFFAPEATHYPTIPLPVGFALGDFDHNGRRDMVVVNGSGGKTSVLLGGCWPN